MRIALIRGSSQRNYELPNYEFGDGHSVDVFVSRRLRLGEHSAYFDVHRLPAVTDLTSNLGPRARGAVDVAAGSLEYLFGLEQALTGYDIAHAFEIMVPLTRQAVRAREQGRVRRVVATVSENIPFKPEPHPLVTRRSQRVAAGADHFIAVSRRSALHLQVAGVPDDRITVMPFGTDVERFHPPAQRRPGPLRVMTSARLEPAKGVEDLLVAFGLVVQQGVDAELVYVGDGPLRGRLEDLGRRMGVAERVTFRSSRWIDMPEIYRDADVFVLASAPARTAREQFGFALIEAMATGLPTLVGAAGALREVVGAEDVLVQPHDPLDLALHLEKLLRDDEWRRELAARNLRFAHKHYDQRLIRRRLLGLYEDVLAREPRG